MFRTGLGKSVAVTKSSISKARSILGDVDIEVNDLGICFAISFFTVFIHKAAEIWGHKLDQRKAQILMF